MKTQVWGDPGSPLFERCYALWVRRNGTAKFATVRGDARPIGKASLATEFAAELGVSSRNLRLMFRQAYAHRVSPHLLARVEELLAKAGRGRRAKAPVFVPRIVVRPTDAMPNPVKVVSGEEYLGRQVECVGCVENWPADDEFFRAGSAICRACEFEGVKA